MELLKVLPDQVLILDGAMGTEIMPRLGKSINFLESVNLDQPDIIVAIHKAYIQAGAEIITTNTLGANRIKLNEFGAGNQTKKINTAAVALAKKARADKPIFIAGSMGPMGKLLHPLGDIQVEEAYQVFAEQALALAQGGADFLLIETHIDLLEAKTALRAAKDVTSIPVAVSLTYPLEEGLTVTGSNPATAAVNFTTADTDIFGVNCGGHPEKFTRFISDISAHNHKPLIVYANAGEPIKKENDITFPLGPEEYASYALQFFHSGAHIIGGCCGTTPEHIKVIAKQLKGKKPVKRSVKPSFFQASSRTGIITIDHTVPFRAIGENINPFARKTLDKEFKQNKLEMARKLARKQEQAGADALDLNLGRKGDKEPQFYAQAVMDIQLTSNLPLFLDNNNPESLEIALKHYSGKAVINSVTGEKQSYETLLPLAKKYGAAVILLALDENGIPEKARGRFKIIEKLYQEALNRGLSQSDLLIDPITLSISASPASARETLNCIEIIHSQHLPTIVGLSNLSFGLPQRKLLNAVFLSMAVDRGLNSAILNPLDTNLMSVIKASDSLTGKDTGLHSFIEKFGDSPDEESDESEEKKPGSPEQELFQAIFEGEKNRVEPLIQNLIHQGKDGFQILEQILSPALLQAGEYYEKKIYFLPQLILAAEAMEKASHILEKTFPSHKTSSSAGKIVLATVKGDLHDIGKNIVSLVLRNFGYSVIDLGKNITAEMIITKAIREKADIIGLSALMTTTLDEMHKVISLTKARAPAIKVIVGGAAVSASFAKEIGADAYGKDALDAVRKIKKIKSR